MFGHMSVKALPPEYPQFWDRSKGSHAWDVDGNEYVDFMCSFGPMLLGYRHPAVEAAAAAQAAKGDTQPGPSEVMVELAELLVGRVAHADWALFAKNGSDATTISLMVARAATGRSKILAARGAYHGATPWATLRMDGVTPEDRVNTVYYEYNDVASVERALEEAGEVAAIITSPFKHDAGFEQQLVDPAFAARLRELCDETGAALVMDEVRTGFRLNDGGAWEPLGIEPDLSAWSKAIANGYPIAAILGKERFAEAATRIFVTGSFWFQAVPMAAAVATLQAIREENAVATMARIGNALRDGIEQQAAELGVEITYTGHVQMPYLGFVGDEGYAKAFAYSASMIEQGVIVHPRHNWFISAAHTDDDVARFLEANEVAFRAVRDAA
jgi:glutamate-1-semialdehyde 2,1-aminomutase